MNILKSSAFFLSTDPFPRKESYLDFGVAGIRVSNLGTDSKWSRWVSELLSMPCVALGGNMGSYLSAGRP
jgi:hypothetical protein